MTRHYKTIRILGLITAIVPFVGLPTTWRQIIICALALLIALLAHFSRTLRPREKSLFDNLDRPKKRIAIKRIRKHEESSS